ncbi:MAG: lytic murein transglycosylase B [Betaproteobacteria bacterium]|nr:lytic murein transglycosylase B [Betaproteobacteria bacterium]
MMRAPVRVLTRLGPFLAACALCLACHAQAPNVQDVRYGERPEVRAFILAMVEQHGFLESELKRLFKRATRQPEILKAIRPPVASKKRSWQSYRSLFVNERHVGEGLRFFEQHAAALERAEGEYGVPWEIIVAIIGVETFYGKNMGKWRVVDALATLAFDYPPRAEFFRAELQAYLLFTREADLDVFAVRGSYAGAIGIPQFMPSSYRRWAVDYDGDGVARLLTSPTDAIGSVANFLRAHGWVADAPISFPAQAGAADIAALLAAGVKPTLNLAQLAAAGVTVPGAASAEPALRASLIELETPDRPSEYRVGLDNFYVLTRYNRSSFYACAVTDLAQAIRTGARTLP